MTESESDEQLIARARKGDQSAFRQIIQQHESLVASTVIRLLGRGHEADDIGQETFVRCFRSLEQFRGDSELSTYLVTIARNLSLTALTRRARSHSRFVSLDDDAAFTDDRHLEPLDPVDAADASERQEMVERALSRLSEAHRSVVVLRLMQGLSTKETAAALSVPEGTVLSRLARACTQLKSLLAPYLEHGGAVEGA